MKDLVILGIGVHAAEMVEIIERINGVAPTWNLLGFIAEREMPIGSMVNRLPVLGFGDAWQQFPQAQCALSFGWPWELLPPRERLVTIIDPSTFVSRTASFGVGCVIYPNCFIGLNVKLGDYVFCLSGCTINHDNVLEDKVTLASGVKLAGEIHIETECYLGQACTIRQQLRIGRNSTIGMGAVVVKDVLPNSTMVGNPARQIKKKEAK